MSSRPDDLNDALVTSSEVAAIIGKTRQRVDQLAAGADFPRPAFTRGRIRLWWRTDVEAWVTRQP